jgi:hypothetical protein
MELGEWRFAKRDKMGGGNFIILNFNVFKYFVILSKVLNFTN